MCKRKVILDVDTGVDDAHALLLALRSPALEVVGITTVAGNVDVAQVTANPPPSKNVSEKSRAWLRGDVGRRGLPRQSPASRSVQRPIIACGHRSSGRSNLDSSAALVAKRP